MADLTREKPLAGKKVSLRSTRHFAPSLRSLAAGWPLAGHYAAPLSSLEAVGRAYPRDVVAGVATQRGPALHCGVAAAPPLAARSGFARLGTTRLRSCSAGRLHLITTSNARPAGPINVGLGAAALRCRCAPPPGRNSGPYIPAFIFFLFLNYGHRGRGI